MKDFNRKDFVKVSRLLEGQISEQLSDPENAPEPESVQSEIRRRWGRCAGRAADASIPLLFRNGRLVIFTESAIWATELRHQQQTIRTELESFNINKIEVKARPGVLPQAVVKRRFVRLSEDNRNHLRSTANRVRHGALRDALYRLSEKRRKSGPT